MNNDLGKYCPKCKKDIGIWVVMKAGWPASLKCPHCKIRLTYEPVGWSLILIGTLIFVPLYWSASDFIINRLNLSYFVNLIAILIFAVALWQPIEYLIVMRLRKKHKLKLK